MYLILRLDLNITLIWSGAAESELGAAARFLIDYIRNKRMQPAP